MICCDRCEEWYHFHCVGIKPEQIAEYDNKPFYCTYSKKCKEFIKKNAANAANGGSKATRNQEKQAPVDDKKVKPEKKTGK